MPGQRNFYGKSNSGPVAKCGEAEKGEATKQQVNFNATGKVPSGGASTTKKQINFKY